MNSNRPWIALLVAGCCGLPGASAQDSESAAAEGAASFFGSPTPAQGDTPESTPPAVWETREGPGGVASPAAPAGTTTPGTGKPGAGGGSSTSPTPPADAPPGSGSVFGTTPAAVPATPDLPLFSRLPAAAAETKAPEAAGPSFTIPGFYGVPSTVVTPGSGSFSRPRFRYDASLSVGYDTNVLSRPDNPAEVVIPAVQQLQLVPIYVTIPGSIGQGGVLIPPQRVVTGFRQQLVVVTPSQTVESGNKPIASGFTQFGAGADMQIAGKRSVFTLGLHGLATDYWSSQAENAYDGSLNGSFAFRVTPRLQFTAQLSGAYRSQPDYSGINAPQSQPNSGHTFSANSKVDLSYRVNPRLTTVLSLSGDTLRYLDAGADAANYNDFIVGAELRYLFSPRFTLIAETRYSWTAYENSQARDASTFFVLAGAEVRLSPTLKYTIRLGESLRTLDQSGESEGLPYFEGNASWRIAPVSTLDFNGRFGFEQANSAVNNSFGSRFRLSYTQALSPRFSTTASLGYFHQASSGDTDLDNGSDTVDASLGCSYLVNRHFSLNASYNLTISSFSQSQNDYTRNRILFGGSYNF